MKILLMILGSLFIFPSTAFAYIDPGIGSILLQSILGGMAIFLGTISLYWSRLKLYFSSKSETEKKKDE